jgi:hypothetical protein
VDELHHYESLPNTTSYGSEALSFLNSEDLGIVTADSCGTVGANGTDITGAHSLSWVLYDPDDTATAGTGETALTGTQIRGLQTTGGNGWMRLE